MRLLACILPLIVPGSWMESSVELACIDARCFGRSILGNGPSVEHALQHFYLEGPLKSRRNRHAGWRQNRPSGRRADDWRRFRVVPQPMGKRTGREVSGDAPWSWGGPG